MAASQRKYRNDDWRRLPRKPILQRLEEKILPEPMSGCWLWIGSIYKDKGYGQISTTRERGPTHAHIVVWEYFRGKVPADMQLDHKCRNRLCVNPDHLEIVTPKENIRRGMSKSAISVRENKCWRGHNFTPENTYIRPDGQRNCRTCKKESMNYDS